MGIIGAIVTGRHDFDVSGGWGNEPPLGVPVFIVTHQPPANAADLNPLFPFVVDGVAKAIELARAVAGRKDVSIGGSSIIQQSINLGMVDTVGLELIPVILGMEGSS